MHTVGSSRQLNERQVAVALLAVALLLGGTLSWERFLLAPLGIDEHVSFWIVDRSSPGSLLERSFRYSATPPLSFGLQRLSLDLCGTSEWALRLPAAVGSLGALAIVWWAGWRMASPLAGGLAALLLATSPGAERLAVAGRPYSIGMLLAILAMYCTDRLVLAGPSPLRWITWSLINLALIQTHYLFGTLWAAELVWLAGGQQVRGWRWLACCVLLVILALSVAPGLQYVWEHRTYLNWTTQTPRLGLPVDWPASRNPIWWGVVALPVLWQLLLRRRGPGAWFDGARWRQVRRLVTWAAVWLVIPVGGLWLLGRFWIESIGAGRYQVICLPASALLLGGLLCLWRGTAAPVLGAISLLLLQGVGPRLTAAVPPAVGAAEGLSIASPVDAAWKEAAEMIAPSATPPDLVLVGSGLVEMTLVPVYRDDPVFHDYVCCRLGRMYQQRAFRRLSLPMFWPENLPGLKTFYREAIASACQRRRKADGLDGAIWLVAATDTDLLRDTAAAAQRLLEDAGATELRRVAWDNILTVVIYTCPK